MKGKKQRGSLQKLLVSEYCEMKNAHSRIIWAICTSMSFVALIFEEDLFSRISM